jgi:hypothetical protein
VSEAFIATVGIPVVQAPHMRFRVANGEIIPSTTQVSALEWWTQGYTFHIDMRVLQLGAYNAILGYDWLRAHSPMVCHWELKTLEF